jgi:hypothetical protein
MDGCKLQIDGIALREEHTKDSREQTENKQNTRRNLGAHMLRRPRTNKCGALTRSLIRELDGVA